MVKFQRELAARNHGDQWQPVELASALYAQALTDKNQRAKLLREAAAMLDNVSPTLRSLRDVRRWRERISEATARPVREHRRRSIAARRAVSPAPVPLFRSSGQRGFSSALSDDPRHVHARKFEREVQVRFAAGPCTVQTPEGAGACAAGDAILTGIAGEHWRVSRAHFARQVPAGAADRSGRSRHLPEPAATASLRCR